MIKISIFWLFLLLSCGVYAGFTTSSSRIIYNEADTSKSLILASTNQYPVVTQTWIDHGDGIANQVISPFVVLPAVFKIKPERLQTLKIIHNGDSMPQDRESVFWLNLLEIPGYTSEQIQPLGPDQARLTLSMNTQLKIFYRPKKLEKMSLSTIIEKLKFSVQQLDGKFILICENMSPYNVSFSQLGIISKDKKIIIEQQMDMMTQALTQRAYELPNGTKITEPESINFSVIDDSGRVHDGTYDYRMKQINFKIQD